MKLLIVTAAAGDTGTSQRWITLIEHFIFLFCSVLFELVLLIYFCNLCRLRDLSLILDALLKTNSYNVLMDIMKTNGDPSHPTHHPHTKKKLKGINADLSYYPCNVGLQMLHTILKQNRDDFNRIPIIRKLLKVISYSWSL